MRKDLRFSDLSCASQMLVRLCQTVDHGSIDSLMVRDGEAAFDPPPIVLRDLKLTEDEPLRPELELADFTLSAELRRFLDLLGELRDGVIAHVEVRKGLPRRALLEIPVPTPPGQKNVPPRIA